MRKKINDDYLRLDGRDLPINTKHGKYYCYVEPMERFKRELDHMIDYHNKVFMFRFDVRLYEYTPDNKVLTKLIKAFVAWVKRRYDMKRVGYIWVRELERSKHQHYHVAVMLDGNKVRTTKALLEQLDHLTSIQNMSIGYCKNPSYMIKRQDIIDGNYTIYDDAFRRVSYFAKERGKNYKGDSANNYQTSRIRPKQIEMNI